jgi:peptide/nickel transport system permease protein
MGTDSLGRDIWSRTLYGARVSLTVGVAVAALAMAFGWWSGMGRATSAGHRRRAHALDGRRHGHPRHPVRHQLVAVWRPRLLTVMVAIAVPEIPRVARLVRSVVLTVREEPYVEAAIALDTPTWKILWRHILPNAIAPLIVQGTFIAPRRCWSRPSCRSWAWACRRTCRPGATSWPRAARSSTSSRTTCCSRAFPGATVLAVNILGDGLRDTLDPKFNKRGG